MIKRLVFKVSGTYKGKDGKDYDNRNYFLELTNGNLVPVKPTFKDGYGTFSIIAEKYEEN